jgi:hypothetical protein
MPPTDRTPRQSGHRRKAARCSLLGVRSLVTTGVVGHRLQSPAITCWIWRRGLPSHPYESCPDECAVRPNIAYERKICRRPAGLAQGRPRAAARRRTLYGRPEPPWPALRRHAAQPDGPRRVTLDRRRRRTRDAWRAHGHHGGRPRCGRHKEHAGCSGEAS